MQLDMHYYGTYAMARMAGLKEEACEIIATAAQFVDDNAASLHIEFRDGGRIDAQATAHHVASIISNRDPEDQRQVWVPFHFLPGNEGSTYSERLLCRKNSAIARQMVENHLGYAGHPVAPYLMGVAAHVYADTFSHHGFSGVGSRRNKVDNDSFHFDSGLDPDIQDYIRGKAEDFFRRRGHGGGLVANIKSWLAETISGALGHGAVATYPDRPYLRWSFKYDYPRSQRDVRVHRDNPADFLEGCEALHDMFARFAAANPEWRADDGVAFDDMRAAVKAIIEFQARGKDRQKRWRKAAAEGELAGLRFEIPRYAPEAWLEEGARLNSSDDSKKALDSNLYRFYQAASMHRHYVLRELLPSHGLVVA